MYFRMNSRFFSVTPVGTLDCRVIWYDSAKGSWQFEYKSSTGQTKTAWSQRMKGDGRWKNASFTIADATMDRSHVRGSDFSIVSKDSTDAVFHMIEIARATSMVTDII